MHFPKRGPIKTSSAISRLLRKCPFGAKSFIGPLFTWLFSNCAAWECHTCTGLSTMRTFHQSWLQAGFVISEGLANSIDISGSTGIFGVDTIHYTHITDILLVACDWLTDWLAGFFLSLFSFHHCRHAQFILDVLLVACDWLTDWLSLLTSCNCTHIINILLVASDWLTGFH